VDSKFDEHETARLGHVRVRRYRRTMGTLSREEPMVVSECAERQERRLVVKIQGRAQGIVMSRSQAKKILCHKWPEASVRAE
jgi:hypothetical protein